MSECWKKSLKFVGNDTLKIHLKLNDPSKALMGNCKWTQSNYNTTSGRFSKKNEDISFSDNNFNIK